MSFCNQPYSRMMYLPAFDLRNENFGIRWKQPIHDFKWKYFPRPQPFMQGIHRSPLNSPHKGQWRSFAVFFDLHLNKRLSKQSWARRFETPSRSLWRHRNDAYTIGKKLICYTMICSPIGFTYESHTTAFIDFILITNTQSTVKGKSRYIGIKDTPNSRDPAARCWQRGSSSFHRKNDG